MDVNQGDKFIIEIEGINYPIVSGSTILYKIKGFNALVFDKNGLKKLEKYDDRPAQKAYNKGLNDAWEAAAKICAGKFAGAIDTGHILNFSATEAIEKIKAYEETKKAKEREIKVGDEVRYKNNPQVTIVVTAVTEKKEGTEISGILNLATPKVPECCDYGEIFVKRDIWNIWNWEKTGKHYDKIERLFGGNDGDKVSF